MAILITGDRGFIGSRLGLHLKHFGIDLKDNADVLTAPLPPIDTVFHLAAQTSVVDSWEDPVNDANNLKMTVRLVHEYSNARIIYANSAAALEPISSPYGFSKWVSAEYIKRFHKNYVICTFPNVYGGTKSVVDIFKANDHVTIYGDGLQTRDFVHVDDIVDGLLKAQSWDVGEYQLGSGIPTTILDLAKGKHITFEPQKKEARESVLQNTTPDWKAKINVHEYSKN